MRFHGTHRSVVHQGMSAPYKNINILLFLYGECGFAAPIIRNANYSVDIIYMDDCILSFTDISFFDEK